MTMAFQHEPPVLSPKNVESTGRLQELIRLFNAALVLIDARGLPRPYLAESRPELNTDTWRVLPDGRMETMYRLRPSLTWHDGAPLTGDDFVFAWDVYRDPTLGLFFTTPQDKIETVRAPDAQTIVIEWKALYPDASTLKIGDFDPLPRHLLSQAFATYQSDPTPQRESFANLRTWSAAYVGLGPYRLDRWEPGALIEASAFADHALGRARIDRVVLRFINDDNTTLTNLLSESVQIALGALGFEQGVALERAWAAQQRGKVLIFTTGTNPNIVQFRPEYLKAPELLDLRVRRALAHSIDPQAVNDGLFDGRGIPGDTFIAREESYFPELDRALTKYPYDARRSEQLMAEAGFAKGRDGFFTSSPGDHVVFPYLVVGGAEYEQFGAIMTDTWRRAGFDIQQSILPSIQMRDVQARATAPGLSINPMGVGERIVKYYSTPQIGTPANRWGGNNRGGWVSPEYDRLSDTFESTLDRGERNQLVIRAMAYLSEMLPAFQVYYRFDVVGHLAELRGPAPMTPDTRMTWNIHEWEL
jgi:peptide/nickel transport system substrate-binding protein